MQSENNINLYIKLSEVAALAENVVHSGDISELKELSTTHADLMNEIRKFDPVYDEDLKAAMVEADIRVKSAITAIRQKQNEIIKQLTANNNRQVISKSYGM